MSSGSLVVSTLKLMTGMESLPNVFATFVAVTIIDSFVVKGGKSMDLIYIPQDYTMLVIIILAIFAVAGPVLSGLFFKNDSKHADDPWTVRYATTMIIDMFVTPSLGLIFYSVIIQEWFPDIDPVAYLVILPIVLLITSYICLHALNEGIKATVEQISKTTEEAVEAANQLKKQ